MSKVLRIGMIGCGEIAYTATAKSIAAASNAEMVIGMDPVADAARSFGETYDIEETTELEEVLGRDDVDAVVISTPHDLHEPLALRAARAGKHVMVEKPIACTLQQADRMIEGCAAAGVHLAVCLISRYNPGAVRAKALIEAGDIGEVMALQFHAASNKPDSYWTGGYTGRVQTDWRPQKARSGGGMLIMNLVHDIDRLRYITGLEAVRVYAEYDTYATDVQVEDFITLSIRYDNGAIGNVLAGSCARGNRSTGNRVYGTEGQIIFERDALQVYTTREVEGLEAGDWTEIPLERIDERRAFVERFAQAVTEGRRPDIPGEEGRKTLEQIVAAYRSGETHAPVSLPLAR